MREENVIHHYYSRKIDWAFTSVTCVHRLLYLSVILSTCLIPVHL